MENETDFQSLLPDTTEVALNPAELRVVLLADPQTLHAYGPVLRRLTVGLLDEVADLTLVCLGESRRLDHLPCPPLRIIKETRHYQEDLSPIDQTNRRVSLRAPYFSTLDYLFPQQRVNRLAKALTPYRPTLIHALGERLLGLAHRLGEQLHVPYIVSLLTGERLKSHISIQDCSAILPYNSELTRKLRQEWKALSSRVYLLPIGTHVADHACTFNHNGLHPHLICCSPLVHGHGLATLINAMKRLVVQHPQIHLTLSGCGHAKKDYWEQVNRLGLNNQVHFVDPCGDIISTSEPFKDVLRSTDIYIEPWPAQEFRPETLEAMSIGTAVVATEGIDSDLFIPDKTALLVPHQNEDALATALDQLLTHRENAQHLAQEAQAYLRKHFLASQMVARLTRIYHQALHTHKTNKSGISPQTSNRREGHQLITQSE